MAFADHPNQELVVGVLQRSLERGRLGHAYLFTSGSLDLLESMASTLAKTLNCLQPRQTSPAGIGLDCCDRCANCARINHQTHPDVHWIRPESKSRIITISQMREVMRTVHLKPTEARFKVFILVAADRLNLQAANAFLKTLEEPPPNSILVLLSTEPERLLETLLSRCLRLSFVEEEDENRSQEVTWMRDFAQSAAGGQLGVLARYRLLGLLSQRLVGLRETAQESLQSRSPLSQHDEVEVPVREKWQEELAAAVEAEYRFQRAHTLRTVQQWLRDIWLRTLTAEGPTPSFPEFESETTQVARRLTPEQALGNLRRLEDLHRQLDSNVQEALALEVGLLSLNL